MGRLKEEKIKARNPYSKFLLWILFGVIVLGCILRFTGIQQDRFVYCAEGMWLNHNREFVEMVAMRPSHNLFDSFKAVFLFFRIGLETAKPLWSFISALRYYFTGPEGWHFVREVSAVSGCLTIFLVYILTKRLYQSVGIACLSAALLAILPSHLYYSQLGLQEAFSTLFFVLAVYLYLRKGELNYLMLALSGFALALVFLSNYRMVISPIFILVTELYVSKFQGKIFNFKKVVWQTLFFLLFGIGVGIFNKGNNIYVSFGWMFHQSNLAKGHFEWLNFLSYPYFAFSLETIVFGLLLCGSFYFAYRREWMKFFPMTMVLIQMGLFSFSQEKAARYLCVVLPFMAIAVALVINEVLTQRHQWKNILYVCLAVMLVQQLKAVAAIVRFTTDYESSVALIQSKDPGAKMLSTQNEIQTLFTDHPNDVAKLPIDHRKLLSYAQAGYKYLIIDPQAYVSYTDDQKRFTLKLAGYLGFLNSTVQPVREFAHFHPELLKRFVFDHNESLLQSMRFLKANKDGQLGKLKIYEMKTCVEAIERVLVQTKNVQ